jgi:hypothetical protein
VAGLLVNQLECQKGGRAAAMMSVPAQSSTEYHKVPSTKYWEGSQAST